ncbi:MAG: alpha/beta hydrolase [Planctomycetota bacterium]
MLQLLLLLFLIYAGTCLLVALFQGRLVWFPGPPPASTPASQGLAFEAVTLHTEDDVALDAWFLPAERPIATVLVCHGNAGSIANRVWLARAYLAMDCSVLLFDYRGYGRSEGRPSEAGTYLDADVAWRYLVEERGTDPTRLVLHGESLGAAVALELTTRRAVGAVVFESAFTSLPDLGARLYPALPVRWLARIRYDNLSRIGGLRVPVLLIHSPADEIVPFADSRTLYDRAPGPKEFLETSGGHNDGGFLLQAEWQDRVAEFVRRSVPRE